MRFDVQKNHNPVGTGWVVVVGIGLLIAFLAVIPASQITQEEEADSVSEAALTQAEEILDDALAGDDSNELNSHLEMEIEEYRIIDQRFETHFDVLILSQAGAGLRGSNTCLTLQLDVEENTLTKINTLDLDSCYFE